MPSAVDPGTKVRLFADDALIYRVIRNASDRLTLQKDLDNLEIWAKTWGMVFNAKKCYMMHIDRSTSQPVHFYTLCGTVLSAVANEKYLGVYIQQDLKWTLQVDQVRAAASRKLGFLRRNL